MRKGQLVVEVKYLDWSRAFVLNIEWAIRPMPVEDWLLMVGMEVTKGLLRPPPPLPSPVLSGGGDFRSR